MSKELKPRLASLVRTKWRRYLVSGGSVYVFELLIIFIAQGLGANSLLAVALSFWIGLLVSFALQKIITFGDKRLHHRLLLPQFLAYCLLVAVNFGFTLLVTKLLSPPLPAVITRSLALAITACWNFYFYKTRLFANTDEPVVY